MKNKIGKQFKKEAEDFHRKAKNSGHGQKEKSEIHLSIMVIRKSQPNKEKWLAICKQRCRKS